MSREHTIDRIRKLLALGESPNENEAQRAIAMAHRLAHKHGVEIGEIEEEARHLCDVDIETANSNPAYKHLIAQTLAGSFKVRIYFTVRTRHRARKNKRLYTVRVVGFHEDVETFKAVYAFAVESFNILFERFKKDYYAKGNYASSGRTKRLRNTYAYGFCEGLERRFKQNEQEWGLVVVVPQEVDAVLDAMNLENRKSRQTIENSREAAVTGIKDAMNLQLHTNVADERTPTEQPALLGY